MYIKNVSYNPSFIARISSHLSIYIALLDIYIFSPGKYFAQFFAKKYSITQHVI